MQNPSEPFAQASPDAARLIVQAIERDREHLDLLRRSFPNDSTRLDTLTQSKAFLDAIALAYHQHLDRVDLQRVCGVAMLNRGQMLEAFRYIRYSLAVSAQVGIRIDHNMLPENPPAALPNEPSFTTLGHER